MNKKGFTLIELLAVIGVLGIILLIAVPRILNTINNNRIALYHEQESRLEELAEQYLSENYISSDIDSFSISKADLISGGYIEEVYDVKDTDDVCSAYVYVSHYTTTPIYTAYISCDDYVTTDYTTYSSLTEYSITNLVTNGSFEDGLSPWYLRSGITISNLKSKYGNYSTRNYHSAQYIGIRYDTPYLSVESEHIYYMGVWMYTVNKGNSNCYMQAILIYDASNHYFTYAQSEINLWAKKSVLIPVPNVETPTLAPCTVYTSSSDSLQDCYSDGVLLVDLTATFGAGNEPSKAWCDKNLDYFDGTKTLSLPVTS